MSCDRFEREGLLQLERGEVLDEHFETCPECQASRRAYEALGRRLASSLDEVEMADEPDLEPLEPPGDWQARVFAGIARREAAGRSRRRRFWAWVAVPALAALLLVSTYLWWPIGDDSGPPVVVASTELSTTILHGEAVRRGLEAQPGDRLRLEVVDQGVQELRIYFNDRRVMARCGSPGRAARALLAECVRLGDRLQLDVELPSRGRYQGVALLADDPAAFGEPTGEGLDRDAGAAIESGAEVRLGDRVDVR